MLSGRWALHPLCSVGAELSFLRHSRRTLNTAPGRVLGTGWAPSQLWLLSLWLSSTVRLPVPPRTLPLSLWLTTLILVGPGWRSVKICDWEAT